MNHPSSWQPFIIVSCALVIATIGTALASPLYPIYQELWQLMPSDITLIFVSYMFGCLITLLFLGRISNTLGFVRTMQLGLCFIVVGLILSIYASNAGWLSLGRFIIGIASGLITTAALLGLLQTAPSSHHQLAPSLSSIITALGFGMGPLVGGWIAQFASQPLVTPYIPIVLGSVMCLFGLFWVKQPANFKPQHMSFKPKLLRPDAAHLAQFWVVAITAFCIFALFSLFASLSPSFVKDILPWHGPLVSGSAITAILVISAITQFFCKRLDPVQSLRYGICICLISICSLMLSMSLTMSSLFFVSDLLFGIGHGLALLGAFGLIYHMTESDNRAAVMSTYLFVAYLGTIVPILAVGYLADHFGLISAVIVFCVVIGVLFLLLYFRQLKIALFIEPHPLSTKIE